MILSRSVVATGSSHTAILILGCAVVTELSGFVWFVSGLTLITAVLVLAIIGSSFKLLILIGSSFRLDVTSTNSGKADRSIGILGLLFDPGLLKVEQEVDIDVVDIVLVVS